MLDGHQRRISGSVDLGWVGQQISPGRANVAVAHLLTDVLDVNASSLSDRHVGPAQHVGRYQALDLRGCCSLFEEVVGAEPTEADRPTASRWPGEQGAVVVLPALHPIDRARARGVDGELDRAPMAS